MENLLKQSEVRSVPRPKEIAGVRAVPIIAVAFDTIPLNKWCSMNTYLLLATFRPKEDVRLTRYLKVRQFARLVHGLESCKCLNEKVPRLSVLFEFSQLLARVNASSLDADDAEVAIIRRQSSAAPTVYQRSGM